MREDKQFRTVTDLVLAMERICPQRLAEPWDKVGLQLGDAKARLDAVLLTLDITRPALEMARDKGCGLILCHHPLIFQPLDSLLIQDVAQELVMDLVQAGISVFAAHTNLDAAAGGVADCLVESLAMALAGQVTKRGSLAVYGRLLELDQDLPLSSLAGRIKQELGAAGCHVNTDQDLSIRRLAAFPGSFSEEFIEPVLLAGVDCVICGETKHSTAVKLGLAGTGLLSIGHDVSERVVLDPLARRLAALLPEISFAVYPGLAYNNHAF